jgi:MFS family permease
LALSWAERSLARRAEPDRGYRPVKSKLTFIAFLAAIALLGIGFQLHSAINAAPAFLKFAKPEQLQYLMPVFWVGFSLLMLPASRLTDRYGGIPVMTLGALIGAAAAWAELQAQGLAPLAVAQFIAGGAWGCVLMSAVAAALAIGHTGSEGKVTGGMFSIFALMALARIAMVGLQFNKEPLVANLLPSAPIGLWLAAAVLLLLAWRSADRLRAG